MAKRKRSFHTQRVIDEHGDCNAIYTSFSASQVYEFHLYDDGRVGERVIAFDKKGNKIDDLTSNRCELEEKKGHLSTAFYNHVLKLRTERLKVRNG